MRIDLPVAALAAAVVLAAVAPRAVEGQTTTPRDQPFVDVPTSHWAFQAVEDLRKKGIVVGYPDSAGQGAHFRGKRTVTRFEAAVALERWRPDPVLMQAPRPAGLQGAPGPRGPRGPQGPKGEPPAELEQFRQALRDMGAEAARLAADIASIDARIGATGNEVHAGRESLRSWPLGRKPQTAPASTSAERWR